MNNLRKAFFDLMVFGRWQFRTGNSQRIELYKAPQELFNVEKEKWFTTQGGSLILTKKGKFTHTVELSMYDIEVLEVYKFEKVEDV